MDVTLIQAGYALLKSPTFDMEKAHGWLSQPKVWDGMIGYELVVDPMLRGMVLNKWMRHWQTPGENPTVFAQGREWGMNHLLSYMEYSWASEHATEHYYRLGAFLVDNAKWGLVSHTLLNQDTLPLFWQGLTNLDTFTPDTQTARELVDAAPLTDLNDYLKYEVYKSIVIEGLSPVDVKGVDEFWGIITPEKVSMTAMDTYDTDYENSLLETFAKQVQRLISLAPQSIGFAMCRCINFLEGNVSSKWLEAYKPIFEMPHSHLSDEEWMGFLLTVYTAHDDQNRVSQQIHAWCMEAWPLEFTLIQAAGLVYDHATLHGDINILIHALQDQRLGRSHAWAASPFALPLLED